MGGGGGVESILQVFNVYLFVLDIDIVQTRKTCILVYDTEMYVNIFPKSMLLYYNKSTQCWFNDGPLKVIGSADRTK